MAISLDEAVQADRQAARDFTHHGYCKPAGL
jgi:hypothetical protein